MRTSTIYRYCESLCRTSRRESVARPLAQLLAPILVLASILIGKIEDRTIVLAILSCGWVFASVFAFQFARVFVERERWKKLANGLATEPAGESGVLQFLKKEYEIERA
jgi:hypothetical protein